MLYYAFFEDVRDEHGIVVLQKGCTGTLETLSADCVKNLIDRKLIASVAPFMVICTCEREVEHVVFCCTIEAACEKANELLKNHIDVLDCMDEGEYENGVDEDDEWSKASPEDLNAWCNYKNYNWDAHIINLAADNGIYHIDVPTNQDLLG